MAWEVEPLRLRLSSRGKRGEVAHDMWREVEKLTLNVVTAARSLRGSHTSAKFTARKEH